MASPPEVHSTLLSSGPGPGPLLASAAAWLSLSTEYTGASEEIGAVVAAVRAGAWQGASAERYVAAHLPYLAWLTQASADSAAAAARHETVAAAFTTALATMPTLAELAANHATHAVLVATNFFGINTVPITLNEADYARMWVQAAATMATYAGVSDTAVASVPETTAAPQILKSLGIHDSPVVHDPTVSNALTTFVADILRNLGVHWNPAAGLLNGHVYDYYSNAAQPIWYLARSLELFEDFLYVAQNPAHPFPASQFLLALALFDWPTHIAQFATTIGQSPALVAAAAGATVVPAGASGLAGLAGLAGLPQPAVTPVPTSIAAVPDVWPGAGAAPAVPVVPAGSTTAPAPVPVANAVAGPPPPPPAPPAAGAAGFIPYLIGPPGIGFDSGAGATAGASSPAKKKAAEPDPASAVAAVTAQRRTRRRRRGEQRGHGDEFMDMNVGIKHGPAPMTGSQRGADPLGFAGTRTEESARPGGLATVAGDEFGEGPRLPMIPDTWSCERKRPAGSSLR